ncbi:MAG: glycine zipper domain-containing protein [Gemmatimonadota bacterium]|nr:glycine zipper domain-containing protein [Gemmatimonadota bacterium]
MREKTQVSVAGLAVLAFAALVGACGTGSADEAEQPDMELALAQQAEPELLDVADGSVPEDVPPESAPEQRSAPPRPAPAPAETPPEESSPVRAVPEAVAQPAFVPEETAPAEPQMIALTAPAGAEMEAELLEELSTKTNVPGDRFQLRVTSPLIDNNRVIIQQNSLITGEVTAVQRSGGSGEEAVIKVAFHEIALLGDSWPMSATVVEAEPETEGRYSTGDKAARIGAGAVAGAILGRVIGGNSKGTVIGAAVGAAAGTAITLATEDVDAVLPEGSVFRLRLDKPLTIMVPSG